MRVLVVIAHYFKAGEAKNWHFELGSAGSPLAKIAALNGQIVALNRYFGPRRGAINPDDVQARLAGGGDALDIVVMTVRGANLLQWIGIDPASYSVEYFDGEPLMLPFEAQRIMRERAGHYDAYAYMEDDLIVDDPAFFAKVAWFAGEFGPRAMLMPVRYEMASTGVPAKTSIAVRLSSDVRRPLLRRDCAPALTGRWNGREQTFRLPNNAHAGCHVVTDDQLRLWIAEPSFYDRDRSWISPLESAATHAPGKTFCLYTAAEPDPWFLAIEHFGTRYAAAAFPAGQISGDHLLLSIAENALASNASGSQSAPVPFAGASRSINALVVEASQLRQELEALKRSRTRLATAFLAAVWRKLTR